MVTRLPAPGHRGHAALTARNQLFPVMAVTASFGMLATGIVAVLEAVDAASSWHWIVGLSLIALPLFSYAGLTVASFIQHVGCESSAHTDSHQP